MNVLKKAHEERKRSQESSFNFINQTNTSLQEEDNINTLQKAALNRQKEQEKKFTIGQQLKDVGEQVFTKGVSGAIGSYGNILEAFGLQSPEERSILPGQREVYNIQSDILEKINRGERPSFSDLYLLSDDDIAPTYSRLPTSKEIENLLESATGIGEGKTPAGRISGRGAKFFGEGVTLPGGGLKSLFGLGASGVAGQSIRESEGSETLATGIEIGGPILQSLTSGKLFPKTKEGKELLSGGKKIGLTEKQLTPLLQSENKTAILSKFARKGTKSKKLFNSIKETLGETYSNLKKLPQAQNKLPNAEQIGLRKNFNSIRNELSKTLAPSPDKEAALNYIENALETLRDTNISPEYLINFWQDINKSVRWNSIQGGKKALSQLKEPILSTLKKVSPEIAGDFEITNKLYSKYAQVAKKLKPDLVDSFINKGEIIASVPAALSIISGNPFALMSLGTEAAVRLLGREMLLNPYFQNLSQKLVKNFNQGSVKGLTELVKQGKEYLERKYPEEKWDFLINSTIED